MTTSKEIMIILFVCALAAGVGYVGGVLDQKTFEKRELCEPYIIEINRLYEEQSQQTYLNFTWKLNNLS